MSITSCSHPNRKAVLTAAAVLALGLLVGCNNDTAANPSTSQAGERASDTQAIEQQKTVFSVPGMDCPMCPITVKRALSGGEGVIEADADLKTKQAYAVFDPSQTDTDALIAAIKNSGFSAHRKSGQE